MISFHLIKYKTFHQSESEKTETFESLEIEDINTKHLLN
jgi:hypothetical protein